MSDRMIELEARQREHLIVSRAGVDAIIESAPADKREAVLWDALQGEREMLDDQIAFVCRIMRDLEKQSKETD